MDLPAMARVLTTPLFAIEPATHNHSSSPTAQQRKLVCSRTFWCCDHAPRGWQLSQLFLPWIILMVLCMPCLSATGESKSTMEAGCLQYTFGGGVEVTHEVASISFATIDGSNTVEIAASKEGLGVIILKDGVVHMSRSSEAETFDLFAQKELFPALCMLPGWSHVWQAFLSRNLQTDLSAKIVAQACSVQEQSVTAILEWGSNIITPVAFKFLTLKNRRCDAEVRVSRILASNAQFCTVDSQEVVLSPGSQVSIGLEYVPYSIGKAEGCMFLQTTTGGVKVKILGKGVPSLIKIHPFLTIAVWQETISLVHPFAKPISIKEAMINQSGGEGVLCRRIDFMLVCSYHGRVKVGPIAEWTVAPHSTTPIMDLSFVVEDEDLVVGTLGLKIYRHSVHLSQFLVVPMKMQWHAGAISSSRLSGKRSRLQGEQVKAGSGRAMFVRKSVRWRVQVSELSAGQQRSSMLITMPKETLNLGFGFSKELGGRGSIGYSHKTLFTSRWCYITEALVSSKLIIDNNSALYPAFWVPCSAKSNENAVGKNGCLAKRSQFFKICRVSAMMRGFTKDYWAFKQQCHRERDTETSFIIQDSSFLKSQTLMQGSHEHKELVKIGICVSKYAGPLESLEFDLVDRAVEGGSCESHSLPLKDSTTDYSRAICHASLTFSRYQEVVLKVSLLILFALFIVLVKLLKQEKFLMTDVRLRHSCSQTFFLHPVCLKSTYITKRVDALNIVECSDDSYYDNKLLNVLARVVGFVLRWVVDSQATIVNVRVQIAESPCVASVDQAPSNLRKSCLADVGGCSMERRCVEKPANHPAPTPIQALECRGCADSTDSSREELFEVNTSSLVGLLTTHGQSEDVSQRPSSTNLIEGLDHTFQLTEKKDRGKRRKKRNNIIDLKQEPERMGQSASSSPPSSPASPATPLASGSVSPFIWSDSRSLRGVSYSGGPRGNAFADSTSRSRPREPAAMCGEQAHCSLTKKGMSQRLQNFGSKGTLELRGQALVKTDSSGKGSVRRDSLKDTCTGENWAAVARRTVATRNESGQRQGFASSSRCLTEGGIQVRPVLLPSATFPQRGRSMQWSPRMLEKKNIGLSDPIMSPSLVSTSLIAPLARAPGSKPSMACNERPLGNNSGGATAQVGGMGICANGSMDQGFANDEYLYDIWGNHFAVFSCTTMRSNTSSRVPSYADATASPSTPSAGFSIFSRDTFF